MNVWVSKQLIMTNLLQKKEPLTNTNFLIISIFLIFVKQYFDYSGYYY